jgi:diaminohydroxyphosphoribosylaminopyrimidine deaminase/5-amino-6-(5-phosphoribosylamino)uracil reductase
VSCLNSCAGESVNLKRQDEEFMLQCIELARRGKGYVSPNPLVGAVIVKDKRIVGKGYHQKFGEAHAEINALRDAGRKARVATLYVNLEPCSHYGKTPPCTDAIISSGIRRVVVGMIDPNPLVKGRGIRALSSAGVEVRTGILSRECRELNEFFVKKMTTGLPFVMLKIAQTLDGKIALPNGHSRWITSKESRKRVHQLRAEYDAVLVGAKTVQLDDPRLTVRFVKGRNPKRILVDGSLSTPLSSRLFSDGFRSQTIAFVRQSERGEIERKKEILERRGVQIFEIHGRRDGTLPLKSVLESLADMNILSVLVEGGQRVFTQFLEEGLVDRVLVFVAPRVYGCDGVPAFGHLRHAFDYSSSTVEWLGRDLLIQFEARR